MQQKSKFLWLYTILLFSIALILIIFAGMTQQNYEEDLENHQTAAVGMQKSVSELTQINENLKAENAALRSEAEAVNNIKAAMEKSAEFNSRNDSLVKAINAFLSENIEMAQAYLGDIDESKLTPEQSAVYNEILKKLDEKEK